ncbi:MAG: hypothetical protein LH702_05160 [Phormidesmis sp. CAN_BIN44]|nr:hypothetical protein [Phormidesmis sp. CAN_BIN44]
MRQTIGDGTTDETFYRNVSTASGESTICPVHQLIWYQRRRKRIKSLLHRSTLLEIAIGDIT